MAGTIKTVTFGVFALAALAVLSFAGYKLFTIERSEENIKRPTKDGGFLRLLFAPPLFGTNEQIRLDALKATLQSQPNPGKLITSYPAGYQTNRWGPARMEKAREVVDAYLAVIDKKKELAAHRECLAEIAHIFEYNYMYLWLVHNTAKNLPEENVPYLDRINQSKFGMAPPFLRENKLVFNFFEIAFIPCIQIQLLFPRLIQLVFGNCGLDDEKVKEINRMVDLESLVLVNNNLTKFPDISEMRKLMILNVGKNKIKGVISLEKLKLPMLEFLSLGGGDNTMDDVKGLWECSKNLKGFHVSPEDKDKVKGWLAGFPKGRVKVGLCYDKNCVPFEYEESHEITTA